MAQPNESIEQQAQTAHDAEASRQISIDELHFCRLILEQHDFEDIRAFALTADVFRGYRIAVEVEHTSADADIVPPLFVHMGAGNNYGQFDEIAEFLWEHAECIASICTARRYIDNRIGRRNYCAAIAETADGSEQEGRA